MEADLDQRITELLSSKGSDRRLTQAMGYTLLNGGKRVRARLFLSLCSDLQLRLEAVEDVAIAIECLHSASLVHDDLPALDDDDFRRGKPSCHKQFDEATAILCGDALVAFAFEVLTLRLSGEQLVQSVQILSYAFVELCHGQQLDLTSHETESPEELIRIHELKTGKLFEASCALAAVMSSDNLPELQNLANIGNLMGQYFQLCDDIIDLHGSQQGRGRPAGSDLKNGRKNRVFGLSKSEVVGQCNQLESRLQHCLSEIEDQTPYTFSATREILSELEARVRAELGA